MNKIFLSLLIISTLTLDALAQGRNCGTVQYDLLLQQQDPSYLAARQQIEAYTAEVLSRHGYIGPEEVVTIPVVVHVLYHPSIVFQNIPHARIIEQIDVLNEDFRALNPDTVNIPPLFANDLADTKIQFCLATRDPDSNWTSGVTRTETNQASFNLSDNNIIKSTALGGHDAWDRDRYLNIWVCNLSGGILGYAQPPGGPASTDGVVISYQYFGVSNTSYPYNKGRTTVHEIGHFFNLLHIWGDDNGACWGSDHCNDTPNQGSDNYGCPTYPHPSCNNTSDMFMNYMDYVDDACMVMFTRDQRDRMWITLNGVRDALLDSDGCDPPVGMPESNTAEDVKVFPVPAQETVTVRFSLPYPTGARIGLYDELGRLIEERHLLPSTAFDQTFSLETLAVGLYVIRIDTPGSTSSHKVAHLNY